MMRVRPLILPVLALAFGCSPDSTDTSELREFKFKGKLISPAAVHALLTEVSDLEPAYAAIDLEGFTNSEVHNFFTFEEEKGWAIYHPGEGEYENTGTFKYRHLGVSKRGVHVLDWSDNGGGSMTWYGGLLVRFDEDRVMDSGQWCRRIRMTSIAELYDPDLKFDGRRLTGSSTIMVID